MATGGIIFAFLLHNDREVCYAKSFVCSQLKTYARQRLKRRVGSRNAGVASGQRRGWSGVTQRKCFKIIVSICRSETIADIAVNATSSPTSEE